MRRAQKLGYALRESPSLAGVRSIGFAIRNSSGIAFAGLSLSTISSRMTEKRVPELATLLKGEARQVEKQLAQAGDGR
ncbi:Bacterial transcriptional regulator [compost metagenome]